MEKAWLSRVSCGRGYDKVCCRFRSFVGRVEWTKCGVWFWRTAGENELVCQNVCLVLGIFAWDTICYARMWREERCPEKLLITCQTCERDWSWTWVNLLPRRCFSLKNDSPSFVSASLENNNITLQSGALHSVKSTFFVFHCNVTVYSINVQEFYETVWSEGWRPVRPHEHWFQRDSRNNPSRLRMRSVFWSK